MLEKIHKQAFTVLKRVLRAPDGGGSSEPFYQPQAPLYGVVTRVNTADSESFNSNILTRVKRIRAFSEVDVNYNDKILLDGEEWNIVGEPETVRSSMNKRKKTTVILIEKGGKN